VTLVTEKAEIMKLKKRVFPSRTFRSLLVVAGVLMLTATLVPRANATLLDYFNFEDSTDGGPPDFTSDTIAGGNPGGGLVLNTITTNYNPARMGSTNPGFALNRSAGDIDVPPLTPNLALALRSSTNNDGAHFDFAVNATFFANMSLSFAVASNGNGFSMVEAQFSINGGGTFTSLGTFAIIQNSAPQLASFVLPATANNKPGLVIRLIFSVGHSNGNDLQTLVDNIQLGGTIVPEPATVAGGLLGVLGLGWHQRRRLIRLVRLRRA